MLIFDRQELNLKGLPYASAPLITSHSFRISQSIVDREQRHGHYASNDMDITDVTCTVSHINEVAQKEGLEKAQALAQSCIAAGYDDVEKQVKEAGNTLMDHYEAAKSFIGEKTDEYSEKAENIKKELMR